MPQSVVAPAPRIPDPDPSYTPTFNVLIVLADALRADRLGCYGCEQDTSPTIDALAQRGYLFEHCYSQAPWTKPSVASMLTGYVPSVHQAVFPEIEGGKAAKLQALREVFVTMPECFRAAGFRTAMFMMNAHCQSMYGFAQGVDDYWHEHFADPAKQTDLVLEWLDAHGGDPFFLYTHLRDPHHPYEPPAKCVEDLFGDLPRPSDRDFEIWRQYGPVYNAWVHQGKDHEGLCLDELSDEGMDWIRAMYEAEILYTDRQVARMLAKLEQLGIAENTIVVFVSDHGEAFREHGSYGHGKSLYNDQTHVPLIIHVPGNAEGVRVPQSVAMYDLYPSLLALCGLTPPDGLQAQSLFHPDGSLAVKEDRWVYSEADFHRVDREDWHYALTVGSHKIIHTTRPAKKLVFNLEQDPGELSPGQGIDADTIRELEDALARSRGEGRALADSFGPPEWRDADPESEEKLRAVGYL
ncbi:MAG: sulfatase [bacterium]|nr:sulfatase [bacterium]